MELRSVSMSQDGICSPSGTRRRWKISATAPVFGDWGKPGTFRKAHVSLGSDSVEIDWAVDSAFRFFPIERDPLLGWRLHLFDMATNKALALCARTETRDYVDIIELHRIFPLPAIVWAACGKDPGYSPLFLLEMMKRFARVDPAKLDLIQARRIDLRALDPRMPPAPLRSVIQGMPGLARMECWLLHWLHWNHPAWRGIQRANMQEASDNAEGFNPAQSHPDRPGAGKLFVTTLWSVVLRAGNESEPESAAALKCLCRQYRRPLYVFARRNGHSEHNAQDLTQGFLADLVQQRG